MEAVWERNDARNLKDFWGCRRFSGGRVSSNFINIQSKLMAERVMATKAQEENGLMPRGCSWGRRVRRLIWVRRPPMAGPNMKPRPKAMPARAMPLVLFSFEVTSAIAAVMTERFAAMMPARILERMKKLKEPAMAHRA